MQTMYCQKCKKWKLCRIEIEYDDNDDPIETWVCDDCLKMIMSKTIMGN